MEDLAAFDYSLPPEKIAQSPLADRSASKLLHLDRRTGAVNHLRFREVTNLLREGDLLVLNDTRVTAMRLSGHKFSGGKVEFLLMKDLGGGRFKCLAKPAKRLPVGTKVAFEQGLAGTIEEDLADGEKILFLEGLQVQARLEVAALAPLPPYITSALPDRDRYQTVYAKNGGSAAAPTAGLHFTDTILRQFSAKGIEIASVTLDVGLDTFRPITAEDISDHRMHGERCQVPESTAEAVARCSGRVVAVGTTAVRTLESFAVDAKRIEPGEKETQIFIRPGYRFLVVEGMFTNFHMPRTTMMLMISAFAGGHNVRRAYEEALQADYRFLSFGDSMLIL